jgi:uncharacterized membrane protein
MLVRRWMGQRHAAKDSRMADAMMSWMLAIPLLGATTGLRSMTPMALICWYAYAGWLPLDGTWAEWLGKLWVAMVVTTLAVAELVADKLPRTPARTSAGPLLWRLLLGGLAGAVAATALAGPGIEGVVLTVIGTLLGAFGGYMIRRDAVEKIGCADWQYAVGEDLFTIGAAGFALHVLTS